MDRGRVTNGPLISVVIPAYNAVAYVGTAIESVITQTWKETEIIVVDDGSSDETADAVISFGSRVTLIRQPNSGVAQARNTGIAVAKGEWIAVLDADDAWLPRKLSMQMAALGAQSRAAAAGCACYRTAPDLTIVGSVAARSASLEDLVLMRSNGGLNGSGLIVRSDVMLALGGYDATLSTAADLDLAVRITAAEGTVTVEEPLFLYRQHGHNMHSSLLRMETDMAALLKKARDSGTLDPRLYERAMGRLYGSLASESWLRGDRRMALRYAARAVSHDHYAGAELLSRYVRRLLRVGIDRHKMQ